MNMLNGSLATALEPEKLEALIHLIREDLGYELHRAVQRVKCQLSESTVASFRFSDGAVDIEATLQRSVFEEWIGDHLSQIEACVDSLVQSSGISGGDVDRVFLTGGSSFLPAVRRIFERRFGAEKTRSGNEFTSVARGLALKAAEHGKGPR